MEQTDRNGPGDISRRNFLKGLASGVAGGALFTGSGLAPARQGLQSAEPPAGELALLIDVAECRNCLECIDACEKAHEGTNDGQSYIDVTMVHGKEEGGKALIVPMHCLHCQDAPCVAVCEGKALSKTPQGAVVVDHNLCVECLSCLNTCPFHKTLRYSQAEHRVYKCDFCIDRISQGGVPACVETCPHDALLFGSMDEMMQEATQRAAQSGALLLYPDGTNTLMLFDPTELSRPDVQSLYGLTEQYPQAPRAKATITRLAHLGWIPVIGGVGYYILSWRKNRMEDLVKTRREGK